MADWNRHILASREMLDMVNRLKRLIDALQERSDEVLSEEDPAKIEFIREYRQSLKDGIRVVAMYCEKIEDAEIAEMVRAGFEALEDPAAERKFIAGMKAFADDEDKLPEDDGLSVPV